MIGGSAIQGEGAHGLGHEWSFLTMKRRRLKVPIRLAAKPTRAHSTKRGARGYTRAQAKNLPRRELKHGEDEHHST